MISYISRLAVAVVLASGALMAQADGGLPSETQHQVGVGDTLVSIANRYTDGDVDVIVSMNPYLKEVPLQVGDYLFVPDPPRNQTTKSTPTALPPNPQHTSRSLRTVPGVQNGLAHIDMQGEFVIVPAPVDKE
jgi:hypothetical protein